MAQWDDQPPVRLMPPHESEVPGKDECSYWALSLGRALVPHLMRIQRGASCLEIGVGDQVESQIRVGARGQAE